MADRYYTIELEDGTKFKASAPDSIAPEAVLDNAEKSAGVKVKKLEVHGRGPGGEVASMGQDLYRGFLRGGAFLKDVLTLPPRGSDYLSKRGRQAEGTGTSPTPETFTWFPQMAATEEALQNGQDFSAPTPQGDSTFRSLMRSGIEGLGGAAAGGPVAGPNGLVRLGAGGVLGGVGANVGERLAGPAGGVIGGLAGGVVGGGLAKVTPNRGELAREVLRDVNPANLDIAAQRMQWARDQGVPITASQGMLQSSNIDDMVNFLANSRQGDQISDILRAQPSRLGQRAQVQVAALPGQVTSPQTNANAVQSAATEALRQGQRRASAAYTAQIPPGTTVQPVQVQGFINSLENWMQSQPDSARAMAQEIIGRLRQGGGQPPPVPVGSGRVSSRLATQPPPTPPTFLTDAALLKSQVEDVIQSYGQNLQNTAAVSKDMNRYAQNIRTLFDRNLAPVGSPMRNARAAARSVYENDVNPLKKSVVGRVAGPRGATETVEAATGRLETLLNQGTPAGGNSEILQLERALRGVDPDAFVNTVKTHLANKVTKALSATGDRPAPNTALNLKNALAADDNQVRGLRDMVAGVARSNGIPDQQLVAGFDNLVTLVQMASTRPARVTNMPVPEMLETAGKSAVADTIQFQYLWGIARKIRATLANDAYQTMDRLLSSPEGLRALQQLGQRGPRNPQAVNALGTVLGVAGDGSDNAGQNGAN